MPAGEHDFHHAVVELMCPDEFGGPDTQTDEDEQPSGTGRDEHNQTCNQAERADSDHEGLVEVFHDRVRVHFFFHALHFAMDPAVVTVAYFVF